MAQPAALPEGIVLTHVLVPHDIARARRLHVEVLGGTDGSPAIGAVASSWIVINTSCPSAEDQQDVTLDPPPTDPDRVWSFSTVQVATPRVHVHSGRSAAPSSPH